MTRDPDTWAAECVAAMSLDEKISLLHGSFGYAFGGGPPAPGDGADGYVPGIPRLGIPDLKLIGAGCGVTDLGLRANGEATAMPCSLALTATWDLDLAREFGAVLGRETKERGFNIAIGGGVNVAREATCGRNFEYHGEDPLLAGKMAAAELRGTQEQGVVATVKHFAANNQETNRFTTDSVVDQRSLHEIDLLPFEIVVAEAEIGAVMSAYNKVNGVYSSENEFLLKDTLKGRWGFRGWVMSDWGAMRSTAASANAGMDQEFFEHKWFAGALKEAVEAGQVPPERVDDMVHRILRTACRWGLVEPEVAAPEVADSLDVAQRVAEAGCVLLKNDRLLPLDPGAVTAIAVIGAHADAGVLSGGGSARVTPRGGNAVEPPVARENTWEYLLAPVWVPSSPLQAIRAEFPKASVTFDDGSEPGRAAQVAASADVAVVFVTQHRSEGSDLPDLALPEGQEALIRAVGAANPKTVVVVEAGGAAVMPWADEAGAILYAWYPGQRGAEAIARIISGAVNPSGKLPLSIPFSEGDLPRPRVFHYHPTHVGRAEPEDLVEVTATYDEGLMVGYRWFLAHRRPARYPFGFGLTYTTFRLGEASLRPGPEPAIEVTVTNSGGCGGTETVQVFVEFPAAAAEPAHRLAAWRRVTLEPGEEQRLVITLDHWALRVWDPAAHDWTVPAGDYVFLVGTSSADIAHRLGASLPS